MSLSVNQRLVSSQETFIKQFSDFYTGWYIKVVKVIKCRFASSHTIIYPWGHHLNQNLRHECPSKHITPISQEPWQLVQERVVKPNRFIYISCGLNPETNKYGCKNKQSQEYVREIQLHSNSRKLLSQLSHKHNNHKINNLFYDILFPRDLIKNHIKIRSGSVKLTFQLA